jgi:hypothetical protein
MNQTETPTIARRDQKHAREVAEGIIEIFNELDLNWITGAYAYSRAIDNNGHEEVYAACAVGVMQTKVEKSASRSIRPDDAGRELFGLTRAMCDGIISGNDYGWSEYQTFEEYQDSNCHQDEPAASCRQKYADYLFGVKIGTRVRLYFRGE